jgi:phytoene dehydrogenase-like protein
MRDSAIVVGGGVCGLMAALLLKQSFKKVTIIEQSERVGGLFRSIKDELGAYYDMGSHIPNATGIEALDTLLFGELENRDYYWHV